MPTAPAVAVYIIQAAVFEQFPHRNIYEEKNNVENASAGGLIQHNSNFVKP